MQDERWVSGSMRTGGLGRWRLGIVASACAGLIGGLSLAPPALGQAPGRCPSYAFAGAPSSRELTALRRGTFTILDRPVRLVPPVNWNQDPYGSESWRSKLHAMEFLDPLLGQYSRRRDRAALRQAVRLVLDWIRAHPRQKGFAWDDKISGDRAAQLGYVTAAGECERVLSPNQLATLRRSAADHIAFLTEPDNYRPGNHGLSMDRGLLLLTGYLPGVPGAADARALAAKRFREGLPIHPQEAVDLEHSPGYHALVYGLVRRVLGLPGQHDPQLLSVAARMRAVMGWLVAPNGRFTRLGDTSVKVAEGWARAQARRLRGIAPTTRSGFGIVKAGAGYLSVAAGYHPFGHKQADELTFELYDRGRQIVTDTGRYGAARDRRDPLKARARAFTKGSQAHSVLVVDDVSYPYKQYKPYGSAIQATGTGVGWYAIQGTNPLVARQGVKHTRWFLYRPGRALVIVDRVTASARHTYTRYFQFDPAISVRPAGAALRLAAGGFSGALHDAPGHGQTGRAIVRGRRAPLAGYTRSPLLGFTTSAAKFAPFIPRTAVVLRSRGASIAHAAVISVRGAATVALLRHSADSVTVRLRGAGGAAVTVTAARSGDRIAVTAG